MNLNVSWIILFSCLYFNLILANLEVLYCNERIIEFMSVGFVKFVLYFVFFLFTLWSYTLSGVGAGCRSLQYKVCQTWHLIYIATSCI
jgi:hypothetical protein